MRRKQTQLFTRRHFSLIVLLLRYFCAHGWHVTPTRTHSDLHYSETQTPAYYSASHFPMMLVSFTDWGLISWLAVTASFCCPLTAESFMNPSEHHFISLKPTLTKLLIIDDNESDHLKMLTASSVLCFRDRPASDSLMYYADWVLLTLMAPKKWDNNHKV